MEQYAHDLVALFDRVSIERLPRLGLPGDSSRVSFLTYMDQVRRVYVGSITKYVCLDINGVVDLELFDLISDLAVDVDYYRHRNLMISIRRIRSRSCERSAMVGGDSHAKCWLVPVQFLATSLYDA